MRQESSIRSHRNIGTACVVFNFILCAAAVAQPKQLDAAQIEKLTGAKPAFNKDENVWKVSFPRDDVKVTVDGAAMPPFMGLTSWAAFTPGMGAQAMVMGDLVLFQDEVNP